MWCFLSLMKILISAILLLWCLLDFTGYLAFLLIKMLLQEFLLSVTTLFAKQAILLDKRLAFQNCSLLDESHLVYVGGKSFISIGSSTVKATHERFSKPCAKKVSVCLQDWQDNKLIASATMLEFGYLHNMEQELTLQFMNKPFRQ